MPPHPDRHATDHERAASQTHPLWCDPRMCTWERETHGMHRGLLHLVEESADRWGRVWVEQQPGRRPTVQMESGRLPLSPEAAIRLGDLHGELCDFVGGLNTGPDAR